MEGVWTSSKLTPPGTLCLHSGLLPQCRSAKTPPVGALVTCCPGLLWLCELSAHLAIIDIPVVYLLVYVAPPSRLAATSRT